MTDVKVRRIDFQFDEDIPFRFNPRNIGASDWVNAATLSSSLNLRGTSSG